MKNPCSNCPFRSDKRFSGLSVERAEDIVSALHRDSGFHCHKTVDYSSESGEGRVTQESKLCLGAAKFLENTRAGGMLANLMFRIGYRMGEITPEEVRDSTVPVYKSIKEFIDGVTF